MKILLLGGSGAIGTQLALKLSALGVDVYVSSRSKNTRLNKIHFIKGNAKDKQFLKSVMSTYWNAIVDFMNYTLEEFAERIDILLSNTDNYCFLSSSRIYANTFTNPITEGSPLLLNTESDSLYLASNEYGLTKAKEEYALKKTGQNNWTIFRPYIIYSEKRFQLGALEKEDWLKRVIDGKKIILHKSLRNKYTTLTYAPDAADVMAGIIMHPNTKCQVYNIAGGNACRLTWGTIANIYQNLLQKKLGRKIEIEYITDEQQQRLRPGKLYYQTSYDRMFNRVFDNSKILSFKSEDSFTTIQDGLDEALSIFLESPQFLFSNQAQEAIIDSFTGEYSNLSKINGLKNKFIYLYYRFIKKH